MPNIRLVVEYDGTDFHGWQKQPGLRTVQGTIEASIHRISKENVRLIGSGRTDAGVHAEGQVANFRTGSRHPPDTWRKALNAHLPQDLSIRAADIAPDDFHARHSAISRTYCYRVLNRSVRSPLQSRFAWEVGYPLDLRLIRKAAQGLRGRHDFTSFTAAGDEAEDRQITLRRLTLRKNEDQILFTLEARRFLWHMVRNIVGFLIEVGRGKRPADSIRRVLQARDRRAAGPTAPPHGLCLTSVRYD